MAAGRCFAVLPLLLVCDVWGNWLNYIAAAQKDGCRRLKFLRPDDGHYLAYHVFLNLSIGIYTSCHHRCVMESRCVSVNIGPPVNDKVVCELSDSDHIQSPQHLKARRGWSYRGTTENLCVSNPCLNNGTCLTGYTSKKYLCVCTLGFKGENCEQAPDVPASSAVNTGTGPSSGLSTPKSSPATPFVVGSLTSTEALNTSAMTIDPDLFTASLSSALPGAIKTAISTDVLPPPTPATNAPAPATAVTTPTVISASVQGSDCYDLFKVGHTQSGVYSVNPDGKGSFNVYCDMRTDGGGWSVFQRRQDGSVDFYRGWNDYKSGFGQLTAEFWLGNDKIHRLTAARPSTLRVELEDWNGVRVYAKYGKFNISDEQAKYRLEVGLFSGTAGDSLANQNNMAFSTKDIDNDRWGNNCAVRWTGAWWYRDCQWSNLNGKYLGNKGSLNGVRWSTFRTYLSLRYVEMKMRSSF